MSTTKNQSDQNTNEVDIPKDRGDQKSDEVNDGFIIDPAKFKEALESLLNQICFVRHPKVGSFAGQLMTDGTGFGFPGGIGFLVDSVEKIYPISVSIEKNAARGVVYLKDQ